MKKYFNGKVEISEFLYYNINIKTFWEDDHGR